MEEKVRKAIHPTAADRHGPEKPEKAIFAPPDADAIEREGRALDWQSRLALTASAAGLAVAVSRIANIMKSSGS